MLKLKFNEFASGFREAIRLGFDMVTAPAKVLIDFVMKHEPPKFDK